MRAGYGAQAPSLHLDPDEPLLDVGRRGTVGDAGYRARLLAGWGGLIELARGDEATFTRLLRARSPVPAGGGWLGWARYAGDLIPRLALDAVPVGPPLPAPAASFLDATTARRAVAEVLCRHAERHRRWCADPDGEPRLVLAADLRRVVGTCPEAGPGGPAGPLQGCSVLVARDPRTGRPYVAAAQPEDAVVEVARWRWPALPLLFGGYFGVHLGALDRTAWAAERALAGACGPAVRARLAAQLDDLLREPDDVLRMAVRDLGSALLPPALRRWVAGLRRRLTALDWSPPSDSSVGWQH